MLAGWHRPAKLGLTSECVATNLILDQLAEWVGEWPQRRRRPFTDTEAGCPSNVRTCCGTTRISLLKVWRPRVAENEEAKERASSGSDVRLA